MATVKAIRVELELEDGGFTRRIVKATGDIKTFGVEVDRTGRKMQVAERHTRNWFKTVRDLTIVTSQLRGAMVNLSQVMVGPINAMVKANAEMERMKVLMQGLSGASGSAANAFAEGSVGYIIDMAQRAPFSIQALTDSFVKMKSVGIDPTKGALEGLTDAVAAFGGDSTVLKRASIAIQQMAGKGVISMEELRQQLGEAVPSAIRLMSRSLGVTMKELVDQISKGQVEAQSALANLFAEFDKTFGGRAQALMQTWNGLVARAQTQWFLFLNKIGDAGAFDEAKNQMTALIHAFDTQAVDDMATALGDMATSMIRGFRQTVEWVVKFRQEIMSAGQAFLIAFAATKITGMVAGMISGIAALVTSLRGATAQTSAFAVAMNTLTIRLNSGAPAMLTMSSAAQALALGLAGAIRTFVSMVAPITAVIAVIWTLIETFDLLGSRSKQAADDLITNMGRMASARDLQLASEEMDKLLWKQKQIEVDIKKNMATIGAMAESNPIRKSLVKTNQLLMQEARQVEERIADLSKAMEKAKETIERESLGPAVENQLRPINDGLEKIRAAYDKEAVLLEKQLQATKNGTKERTEVQKQQLANSMRFHDARIALVQKAQKDLEAAVAAGDEQAIKTREKAMQRLIEMERKFLEAKRNDPGGIYTLLTPDDKNKNLTEVQSRYKQLSVTLAGLHAQLAGGGKRAAEEYTRATLEIPAAADITGQTLARLADEVDAADKKLKELKATTRDNERGLRQIGDLFTKAADKLAAARARLADPGAIADSEAFVNFKSRIDKLVAITKEGSSARIEAERMATNAFKMFKQEEVLAEVNSLRDKSRAMRASLLPRRERIQEELRLEEERVRRMIDLNQFEGEERKKVEKAVQDYIQALRDKASRDQESAIDKMMRDWANVTERMEEAGARFIDDFVDKMVDGLAEGKMAWADWAEFVLKEIIKIQTRAAIAKAFGEGSGGGIWDSLLSFGGSLVTGMFGGGGYTGTSMGDLPGAPVGTYAKGGAFSKGVEKFASSGVVSKPTMFRMQRGLGMMGEAGEEGILPLRRMGNGDLGVQASGGGGAPQVQVNVINQSGQQVSAEQRGQRFDGKQFILDVVLTAANKPGRFRDGLRQATG